MIGKIKVPGLTLLAALALTVVAVPAAPAAEFHSEATHTNLTGSGVGQDVFTFHAGTVKCVTSDEGTSSVSTSGTLTLTPWWRECNAFGFVNVPVHHEGCNFVFHLDGGTPASLTGSVDIVCPEGKSIKVTAFNCEVTVLPQTGLRTVTFTNEGSGTSRDIKIDFNLTGLTYIQHSKSFPGCNFSTVLTHSGTYTAASTVKGFNTSGNQVGIWGD
jgi:hypothetical protein